MRQTFDTLRQQLELAKREAASLAEAEAELADRMSPMAWSLRVLRAFTVQSVYSGVERILRVVVDEIDREALSGRDWHATLLAKVASERPGVRPAVIGPETFRLLDDLRRFRHVARNHYGIALDEEGTRDNVAVMRRLLPLLEADLRAFEAAMTRDDT